MPDCPTEEQLAGYVAGACADDDAERIRIHIAGCTQCASWVTEAEANEAIFDSVRGVLQDKPGSAKEEQGAGGQIERSGDSHPLVAIEGFEIQEEIGRGGIGVVYKAQERDPPRTVALKILLEGPFASEASKRRFEREVELAAQLEHPNIVTILESGIASGRHYFVMQHVDGRRLDKYMAVQEVSIDDKLRLFGKICQAVNYAHQRGIIHRDLKPSNILIDRDGAPKILDFGLAKMADLDVADAGPTLLSLTGQVMGTLPYMSPEQATGALRDIDVRTDVYSLGVVLYEMLTGEYPYQVVGQMADVLKNIAEAEPKKPSTIRRQINDEVETIVLKALAKDRDRRYQSAEALARDVGHYLTGEAIDAKRDSGWYVFKKTVRRYKAPVAVATAFIAVLTAGAVVSRIQYAKAEAAQAETEHERDIAIQARNESDKARADADAVTDYLAEWLSSVDPEKQGIDVTLREMLDQAAETIGEQFADKPLIEARLRQTVGWTYRGLGLYDKAEGHLADAAALYRRAEGPRHPMTLSALSSLANVLRDRGDYTVAVARHKAVLEIQRRVLGDEHPHTLNSMNNLALALDDQGLYAESEALNRTLLEIRRRVLGDDHPSTLASMSNLAILLDDQGKYAEAEALHRKHLEIERRVLGEEHPGTLMSVNNLAASLQAQGEYAEAEALYRKTLNLKRRVLGEEHPDTLMSMANLASVLFVGQGKYSESEVLHRKTLAIKRRVLGEAHPDTLASMNNLALVLRNQSKYAEAEALFRETLEMQRRAPGPEHPRTLRSMDNLAVALAAQGKFAEGGELHRKTLDILRRVLGEEHPDTLLSMDRLLDVLNAENKFDESRALARKLIEYRRRRAVNPEAPPNDLNKYASLLVTCEPADLRRPETALVFAQKAVEETNENDYTMLDTLALAYQMTGDLDQAVATQRKALALLPPDRTPLRTRLETKLGEYLVEQGAYTEAEPLLLNGHQALTEREYVPPDDLKESIKGLVKLYEAWDAAEPDKGYYAKAARWRVKLPKAMAKEE